VQQWNPRQIEIKVFQFSIISSCSDLFQFAAQYTTQCAMCIELYFVPSL